MLRSIRSSSVARIVALVAVTVTAAGCTLVGFGVGVWKDRKASNRTVVADWQLATLKAGESIDLVLGGGRQVTGRFGGVHLAPPAEYAQAYNRWREAGSGAAAPMLGPGATLRTRQNETRIDLVGFDPETVVVRATDGSDDTRVPMDTVIALSDAEGMTVDGPALLRLAATGRMPFRSRVAVDTGARRVFVPLDEVVTVLVRTRRNEGKIAYTLIGLGIDILVLAVLNADTPPASDDNCCASSCPWVYTFDGERYVLEGDILGGTLFRSSQRTDRLGLGKLAAAGGEYRVRLENPQQEIQYVDDAALLVIDHRRGARVVSSAAGLSLVDAPVAPVAATDLIGQEARSLVAAADGRSWTSLPAGLGRSQTRDALRLVFPQPAVATAATLVLRTRSTIWSAHLLRSLLGLHGRDLPAWFARMENDDRERQAFEGAIAREGLLHVRVWDGSDWKVVGMVPPSRAATREHAFRFAVPAGETLRVELASTAGLWMVDSALADYGTQDLVSPTELRPVRARAGDGADLRRLLRAQDGRAFAMHQGERAELAFSVPAPVPGRQRSLVARLSGYYTVLVPSREPAQGARFRRLMDEPGALGEYARSRLSTEVRAFAAAAHGRRSVVARGYGGADD
jgi:hypothetical protein